MVLDMTLFTAMALELSYQEFKARYCEENQAKIQAYLAAQEEEVKGEQDQPKTSKASSKFYKKGSNLPLISSECPGWVCYAEKRVGDLALPHMSKSKSPQ